jgi:hypothetical protein
MGDILCSFDRVSDSRQPGAGVLTKRYCWDDAAASPATALFDGVVGGCRSYSKILVNHAIRPANTYAEPSLW